MQVIASRSDASSLPKLSAPTAVVPVPPPANTGAPTISGTAQQGHQLTATSEIKHDPIASTPSNRLLTALRGKDVLLVFVEAYGQQAVEGRSFSPEVDSALAG